MASWPCYVELHFNWELVCWLVGSVQELVCKYANLTLCVDSGIVFDDDINVHLKRIINHVICSST